MPVASATPLGPAADRASSSACRGSRTVRAAGAELAAQRLQRAGRQRARVGDRGADDLVAHGSSRAACPPFPCRRGSNARHPPAPVEEAAQRLSELGHPAGVVRPVEDVPARVSTTSNRPGTRSRPPRRPRRPRPARRGTPRPPRARPRSCAAGRRRASTSRVAGSRACPPRPGAPRAPRTCAAPGQRIGVQSSPVTRMPPAAPRPASRRRCRPPSGRASACAPGRRSSAPARARG